MIEWKDITSYSQGDEKRVPRVWAAKIGRFTLKVHRHTYYEPDEWLMSTSPRFFECERLESKDLKFAQSQAVGKLQVLCEEVVEQITSEPNDDD